MMLIDDVIKAWKLTKRFGSFTAVNGIDFSVHAGECFGLLGPNGAHSIPPARAVNVIYFCRRGINWEKQVE